MSLRLFVAVLSVVWFAPAAGALAGERRDVVADDDPAPILAPGGSRAASALSSEPDCDPAILNRGFARLRWRMATTQGRKQRVVVTIFPNGFERGAFEQSGDLPPNETSFLWDRVRGQARHSWRVLTLHEDGWVPSETATFDGPACVADFVPP